MRLAVAASVRLVEFAAVAETPGVVARLGAARERCADDDAFLAAASTLLDDLLAAFTSTGSRAA